MERERLHACLLLIAVKPEGTLPMEHRKKVKAIKGVTVSVLAVCIASLTVFSLNADRAAKRSAPTERNYAFLKARVERITYDDTGSLKTDPELREAKQEFAVTILDSPFKGEKYDMRNTVESVDVHRMLVSEGDVILVNYTVDQAGKPNTLHLYEIVRDRWLYALTVFFAISLIVVCGRQGLKAVISLAFTGLMVVKVLIPIILAGYPSIPATLIVLSVTAASCLCLLTGLGRKTVAAAVGTVGGLLITALLSLAAGTACKVTGLANTDAQMVAFTGKGLSLDYRAILFSAIIVGALGAAMDVAVSIASALTEIIEMKPDIGPREIFRSGMRIGKDIMATMASTLILAYLGGSFSLFLLFFVEAAAFGEIINLEIVTTDIITALAGSIGVVWTVPITVIAVALTRRPARAYPSLGRDGSHENIGRV
jgi:uncharacterized membrane protein